MHHRVWGSADRRRHGATTLQPAPQCSQRGCCFVRTRARWAARSRSSVQVKCQNEQGDHVPSSVKNNKVEREDKAKKREIPAAARAAMATGVYAIISGIALTIAPYSTFGLLFQTQGVSGVWIRVGGILFTLIGMQYWITGRLDAGKERCSSSFYQASVWSRLYLVAAFTCLVLAKVAEPTLMVLVALNCVGAFAMWRCLRGG